jgi:NAD(P)-dependent dehydrogenase (short-subunit alcohol dehydrogenase family)
MDITGKNVLILGGSGLVGMAVAREILARKPAALAICGLTEVEADGAIAELRAEGAVPDGSRLTGEWGDVFLPQSMKDRGRRAVLEDPDLRGLLLDDLYGELTEGVLERSALGALLQRNRPDVVIDCINTATAFAYQNVFDSARRLRRLAVHAEAGRDDIESHLATLYMPQLIRHVQIALEVMRRVPVSLYLKIGTSGTGGMGLNIPFTHSEERPSRMLLAKAGMAGAQTLLLYLMARTPDGPVVKEIKPTAAISWKRIAYGEVRRGGRPIECIDSTAPVPVEHAFDPGLVSWERTGVPLRGVYIDSGENGLFSMPEFEALTALGLMEYITPEEIAQDTIREILGQPTGHDVVAALDASTSGPTYRAGVMRQVAIDRMEAMEREQRVESVAYEMLGPPRLSKLLFEGALLHRLFDGLSAVAAMDATETAARAEALVLRDRDLRVRMLAIGVPILLADGERLLRGMDVKSRPGPEQSPSDPRLAENGWVDLRPANWAKWAERARAVVAGTEFIPGPEGGSRLDLDPSMQPDAVRPGFLAAWVFRVEDRGMRVKR